MEDFSAPTDVPPSDPRQLPSRFAIGLGANLGDRSATMAAAIDALGRDGAARVLSLSPFVETEPVLLPGAAAQPSYLNAAAIIETMLGPRDLLSLLNRIELRHGRDRAAEPRWAARTLDLDLLLWRCADGAGGWTDRQHHEPDLDIPHPRMATRRFVLEPLAWIAPEWHVPIARRPGIPMAPLSAEHARGIGWATVAELLADLQHPPAEHRGVTAR